MLNNKIQSFNNFFVLSFISISMEIKHYKNKLNNIKLLMKIHNWKTIHPIITFDLEINKFFSYDEDILI